MNNIINKCSKCPTGYNKIATSGNDPTGSKSTRLSQYVRTNRHTKYYPNPYGYLDDRGLVYTSYVKITAVPTSTYIDNDIIFPRDKIFITAIQRNLA
jgi:hypothetical protein